MDEFELFRAQAYSGGIPSSPLASSSSAAAAERSSQYLHEYTTSGSSNARRRRHSSAIVGQEATEPAATDSAHPQHYRARDRRHRLLAGTSGQHHQSLDQGGSYDIRDAVVTVAVEPPSPTETRRQFNIITPFSSSASTPTAADMERIVDNDDDNDDFDDTGDMIVRSNVKANKSPLVRRVTSPEAVMRSSQQAEVTSEVDNSSIAEPIAEDCIPQSGIDVKNVLLTFFVIFF